MPHLFGVLFVVMDVVDASLEDCPKHVDDGLEAGSRMTWRLASCDEGLKCHAIHFR